jgi:hypothetical protein
MNLFREFKTVLENEDCRVADQISLSQLRDEYGRLEVWGWDSEAQRTGRGFLDDMFRHKVELRFITLDILEDLSDALKQGNSLDICVNFVS